MARTTNSEAHAKLTVTAGDKEVHLEARPEIVREELDRVLDRLFRPAAGGATDAAGEDSMVVSLTAPRPETAPARHGPPNPETGAAPRHPALDFVSRAQGRENLQPGAVELLRHAALDPAEFKDLYSVDPGGRVCLLSLPRTSGALDDLLRLLLYGMLTLRGRARATGGSLLHGARSLGLPLLRVPRKFGRNDDRVAVTGRHRAKRYRLTVAGIRHCEALIGKLLAQ